jgi:hypothetical protein
MSATSRNNLPSAIFSPKPPAASTDYTCSFNALDNLAPETAAAAAKCGQGDGWASLPSVIALGGTGAGKSLFLSYLNGTPDVFPSAADAASVTAHCTGVVFASRSGDGAVLMVDTPGLNDSGGSEQSEANMREMIHLTKKLTRVVAFVVVLPATESRFDAKTQAVLEAYVDAFGPFFWQNVAIVVSKWHMDSAYVYILKIEGAHHLYRDLYR